jgi:hypothetical protein
MPFLTEVDSRAAIKGSRDPLGFVPVWSRFGREVVGNLSTVSSSARGFATLLLGYYFAEQVTERYGDEAEATLALFLKFEQLAGYSRFHVNGDDELRGIDRVKAALAKGSKVVLASSTDSQILSNQKIYGLWGLYSVASRESGLLEKDNLVLTPAAREFVEQHYVQALSADGFRDGRQIIELLAQRRTEIFLDGRHAALASSLARILKPRFSRAEREFYTERLVYGGGSESTAGRQRQLADLMAEAPTKDPFGMSELRAITKRARKKGAAWQPLADQLDSIDRLETLLVPASAAFAYCLGRNGDEIGKVAANIRKCWGPSLKHLAPEPLLGLRPTMADAFHEESGADRLLRIASAFHAGAYEEAIRLLIEHNAAVMRARSGAAPWIVITDQRLDVRLRDEAGQLPERSELPHLWRNTYFINSLKAVQTTLMDS